MGLVSALALLGTISGCWGKTTATQTAPAVPIVVERRLTGDSNLVDDATVAALLAERGRLATSGAGEAYRLRCKLTSERGTDKIAISIEALLEEQKLGGRQLRMAGAAELPADKTTPQALAKRLLGDMLDELGARLRLYYDAAPVVVAALDSKSHELQLEALEACGERKLAACTDRLIALLRSDDLDQRDRAIGALQRIGDRRAVRPLTEVAKFGELDELPKILQAMATIGGPEARAYLEFVANGHELPAMRALAQRHLTAIAK